jgi:pimeloyl-ACP methyl ester carboxylesterase
MLTISPLRATLDRFRASHPYRSLDVGGVRWEYIACGQGDDVLLLLPGAPGRADTAFEHVLHFEGSYRVIAPCYPAQPTTVAQVLDGLVGILNAEGVEAAHVVGGSYSGLIAQSLVRGYPGRVAGLILSDTGVPNVERARKYSRYLVILRALPGWAVRVVWRLGMHLYLREIAAEGHFWRAYFRELTGTITKEECVGRLKVWIDWDRNSRFSPSDLTDWPGRVLILEAEHDTTFPVSERAALRRLYPQAQTRVFSGGGHAASITRRGEYIAAIAKFMAQPQPVPIEAAS